MGIKDYYDAIGVIGSALILFGFYRTSIGRWTSRSLLYELDNLAGAVLVIIYQLHYHVYYTVILNAVWMIVAIRGLTSMAERRASAPKSKPKRKSRSKTKLKQRHSYRRA